MGEASLTTRPVDDRAIMRRYFLKPRVCVLYVVALSMIVVSQLSMIKGDTLRDKWMRLTSTTIIGTDPLVVQEAQRQLAALEQSGRYTYRYVIRFGPTGLALLIAIPVFFVAARGNRAVMWARKGRCTDCGYDLQGSGYENACPECEAPPAPMKDPSPPRDAGFLRRLLSRKTVIIATALALFAGYLMLIGGAPVRTLFGVVGKRKVMSAYREAPHVLVRWRRVVSDDGSWRYAYLHDRTTEFARQEWWELGVLEDALVTPADPVWERYLPAMGVKTRTPTQVPPKRVNEFRSFGEYQIGPMADAVWYDSELMASSPKYDVYRSVRRAGLHDHHAKTISIVVMDTESRRPLYKWDGTFDEMLDSDAVPPLRRLWITEIEYPDAPPGPEMLRLDESRPGVLRADGPPSLDWLDAAWIDPVLDDAPE